MKMMLDRSLLVLVVVGLFASGCKHDVEYFCDDDTPCLPRYPDKPYCDFAGNFEEGIGNTCVASPFDAGVIDAMGGIDAGPPDAGAPDAEPPECTEAADCDDGKFCTGVEDCVDNVCVAGTVPACGDSVGCTVDSCDTVADECSNLPDHDSCTNPSAPFCDETIDCRDVPCSNSTECDDGIFCNGAETCEIPNGETVGSCQGGSTPDCADSVGCTVDTCSTGLNECANTATDSLCDNNLFCDGAETCHQTLDCQPGSAPTISDGVDCTDDSCDEANDIVVNAVNNGNCDNNLMCDGLETCHPTLDCQTGTALSCDNGLFCDGAETCDDALGCQNGTPPTVSDGVGCTNDSCDEINDVVVNTVNHASCSNNLMCDGQETCHPTLDCQAGAPLVCDNGKFCDGAETCNDAVGCQAGAAPDCDNGLYCDGQETCHDTLGCQTNTRPDTDDGVACTDWTCDELNDIVTHAPDNAKCTNATVCDGNETCHQTMGCQAGTPLTCDNGMYCDGTETCDDISGCQDEGDPVCSVSCNEGFDRCNECVANSSVCAAGVTTVCDANGLISQQDTCALGCYADGTRCTDVDPSNGLGTYLDQTAGKPDFVLDDGSTINTTTGEVRLGNNSLVTTLDHALISAPANGVSVRVLIVGSITLGDVTVSGSPALAIVSNGDVRITGKLDLGGGTAGGASGSGYSSGGCIGSNGTATGNDAGGGAGAGFGTYGGRGGHTGITGASGGSWGSTDGSAQLIPLRGGCSGGTTGTYPTSTTGRGGGAVQIVSRTRIELAGSGEIDVSGGGGGSAQNFFDPAGTMGAGVGGGSGGGALLEAPTVEIASGTGIHANGGSGGCAFANGSPGLFQLTRAPGATCADSGNNTRGDGGAGDARDTTGGPGVLDGRSVSSGSNVRSGGGGGGGVGRIRINAQIYNALSGSVLSPIPSSSSLATR